MSDEIVYYTREVEIGDVLVATRVAGNVDRVAQTSSKGTMILVDVREWTALKADAALLASIRERADEIRQGTP